MNFVRTGISVHAPVLALMVIRATILGTLCKYDEGLIEINNGHALYSSLNFF